MTGKEKRAFLLSLCLYYKGGDLEDNPYSDPETGWQPRDPEMNFKWAIYRGEYGGLGAMNDPSIMSEKACANEFMYCVFGYMCKAGVIRPYKEGGKPYEPADTFPEWDRYLELNPKLKEILPNFKYFSH